MKNGEEYKDVHIDIATTFEGMANYDLRNKPACVFPRKLSGDFNHLSYALAHYLGLSKGESKTIDKKGLLNFQEQYLDTMHIQGHDALSSIFADIESLEKLPNIDSWALRVIYGKNSPYFHYDGVDRILSSYTEPTTQALSQPNDTTRIKAFDFRLALLRKIRAISLGTLRPQIDLLKLADHFSFTEGHIWKQAGRYGAANGDPMKAFFHRGNMQPSKPKLLLIANLTK